MSTAVFRFNVGDKARDRISKQVGVITSRAEHLFGCNRYWIEPQELKDGKPIDGRWLDEDCLELVKAEVIARRTYRAYDAAETLPTLRRAGGPTNQPSSSTRQTTR